MMRQPFLLVIVLCGLFVARVIYLRPNPHNAGHFFVRGQVELESIREQHQAAVSALAAERAASEEKVQRLAQQVKMGESEKERLELELETTVQLTEMALAAKGAEVAKEDQQQQVARRAEEESVSFLFTMAWIMTLHVYTPSLAKIGCVWLLVSHLLGRRTRCRVGSIGKCFFGCVS